MSIGDLPNIPSNKTVYPPQLLVARGSVSDHDSVELFGSNNNIGTALGLLTTDGFYRTPQPADAVNLRIKAGGNAGDTADGAGARSITLQGLDENGNEYDETIATNGASASLATSGKFMRLMRAVVETSGTYADFNGTPVGSHIAAITIESTGGEEWGSIILDGALPEAKSLIGCWSTPVDRHAFLNSITVGVDATKATSVRLYQRRGIMDAAPPYSRMSIIKEFNGLNSTLDLTFRQPIPIPHAADLLAVGKVATGTGDVEIKLNLTIIDGPLPAAAGGAYD